MSEPITAAEALAIATAPTVDELILAASEKIVTAARAKRTSVRLDGGRWTPEYSHTQPPEWEELAGRLRALGFKVEARAEERQFVDLWTDVSWEDAKPGNA